MSGGATVTVADILELRADGLTEEEVWSLLCQAVQTLQDLFLSGKISDGKIIPLVSPTTLAISKKGAAIISLVGRTRAHQEPYLAPEYPDLRRCQDDLDLEKMWVYSLGRTLLSALKATARMESLRVLRFMTAKDPTDRASLMSVLNVISEYCKTNPPTKPSSHLVMEMYKEVFGSPTQCLLPSDVTDSSNSKTGRIPKTAVREARPTGAEQKAFSSDGFGVTSPAGESKLPPRSQVNANDSKGRSVDGSAEAGPKRNAVRRAPSRLYRGPLPNPEGAGRRGRLLPSAYVGPEFVVRGMEPAKVIHVGDSKASHRKALTVILLTGQRIRITCDPHKITCGKILEVLVQVENIEDNYIFGLASTINGDFVFVPSEMKLRRVAPGDWKDGEKDPNASTFFLYLRVKFFLPSLWRLKNGKTKHLMYLQLRRSLLEQQIKCELDELVILGGLALQAEFGDFDESEHGGSPYFLLEHYIPEELVDKRLRLEDRLQGQHKSRRGLDPSLAEEIFVAQVQRLPEYGSHHYTAFWVRKSVSIPMWVTVNPQGVYLYEKKKNVLDRKIHEAFPWKNIQGLSCNESYFRLVPQDVFGQKVTCYKLRMDKKKSFFLFRLASFHHRFFLKLRIELSPLHALSQEFGVACKKDNKNVFYVDGKASEAEEGSAGGAQSASRENIEERQNKENENPAGRRRGRGRGAGVKMGVSSFHSAAAGGSDACGRSSFLEISCHSLDAYVIDSSIRSSEERFAYDLHESIPSKLADRWDDVSWEAERILLKVRLRKDKYGSFGLEIVEGCNGGLFVESVLKKNGEDDIDSVRKGDQLVSVNGICLLNLNYSEALNVLKNAGNEIEVLVSQSCEGDVQQKPLEREYLKNIRYETANEVENLESEMGLKTSLL